MRLPHLLAGIALAGAAVPAGAATVIVDAHDNSVVGGVGKATGITLTTGQTLTVVSALTDLWSAGPLPRWSNANGLTGDLFATGSDESGEASGTLIGQNAGSTTQDGFTAPFGALVGKIGSTYQLLGANYSGTAWADGELLLFYWDSNNVDNSGTIAADVNGAVDGAVPEPATWAMMILGFGMVGGALRRRRQSVRVTFA